jgi:glycerophosphoryl diester phosphodiesterase
MSIISLLENPFHRMVDPLFAKLRQPVPTRKELENCRLISHRGEHNNYSVLENTFPAFDAARNLGVWGIEFDVRWTKDLHPVVFHDEDCQRVFQSDLVIGQINLAELHERLPLIPSLEQIIQRYGRKLHLMVELKEELCPDPAYQGRLLGDLFAPLQPQADFHLISLAPEMFRLINFVPSSTFLPIARINIQRLSDLAIRKNYGGLTGHYLFMTNNLLQRHKARHQGVGTGFIASENCLFRELNRGVDWVFSNNAGELQLLVDTLLKKRRV